MAEATIFSDDPVAMASHWRDQGCRRLHIVDLDGAFAGEPRNRELIQSMVEVMGDVPVQVGGGIRTQEVVNAYFDVGVAGVIVGTQAIVQPEFLAAIAHAHPDRVWFGLDARNGRVATQGWDETSELLATDLAIAAAQVPLAGIVYTDIDRDGMMSGLNIEATLALAKASKLAVVASAAAPCLAGRGPSWGPTIQVSRSMISITQGCSTARLLFLVHACFYCELLVPPFYSQKKKQGSLNR